MSRIYASVTSPAAVRAEGPDWEAILETMARERAAIRRAGFVLASALSTNPDLIAQRLMDERFLPLRGSVGFFARSPRLGLDHRQGLLELEINSGFVFAVHGVGPQSRGPGQAVRAVFLDYTRQRHDQAPRHLKVRADTGKAWLAAQMDVVRQVGPLPLGETDLGRLASAGLLVVEPGHLHDVVHGSGCVSANQLSNRARHVGVSVQQGSADPFLESGRDLGDRQIKTLRLVAGECVPLDGHRVLDRGEAGQLVDGGVDEFLGSRIGHALDLLRRLSIGPRVAGDRQ